MLQLKLIVGKGKLVSTEGVGLVRVDPRFSRSSYSRSAQCRGQGAGEPELEVKKERKELGAIRTKLCLEWERSEASLGRRLVLFPQASRRHWPRPRDKVRPGFQTFVDLATVCHSFIIHSFNIQ